MTPRDKIAQLLPPHSGDVAGFIVTQDSIGLVSIYAAANSFKLTMPNLVLWPVLSIGRWRENVLDALKEYVS